MPTHFSFSFGIGEYLRFQFEYGKPSEHSELSPARLDHRTGMTEWEMAVVRDILKNCPYTYSRVFRKVVLRSIRPKVLSRQKIKQNARSLRQSLWKSGI